MTARRGTWIEWTVRLIALLFVVHGALLAFSQGASADTLRRDQFGNVLCLASDDLGHGGAHGKTEGHAGPMACCSLGCAMFAGVVAPPVTDGLPVDIVATIATPPFASYEDALASVPKSPRTTRGPPESA